MTQSEKPLTTSGSGSAVGTAADVRAGPIRLHVRGPALLALLTRPASAVSDIAMPGERVVVLHHNGNEFSVRASMALVFQKNAARVLAAGGSELVVLAHVDGVELLLIAPTTPFHFDGSIAVDAERTIPRTSARQHTTNGLHARAPRARRTHELTAADLRSAELTLST